MDITVVVSLNAYNDSASYYTGPVDLQIVDPADDEVKDGEANSIYASNHTDSRSYVTVYDALVQMQTMGLIGGYSDPYGGYIQSITVDGISYAASGSDGWQYRVYQYNLFTDRYEMVPMSEVLGIVDMDITAYVDIVQWRYGSFYDADLFPDSIPA